jgi:hypothetical protein
MTTEFPMEVSLQSVAGTDSSHLAMWRLSGVEWSSKVIRSPSSLA